MKIDFDYGMKVGKDRQGVEIEPPCAQEMTANYIAYAVGKKHPNGLNGRDRRLYARLQRKLDDAIDQKAGEIDLETGEKDFLRSLFNSDEVKFPPGDSKYVVLLEDEIESLKETPKTDSAKA